MPTITRAEVGTNENTPENVIERYAIAGTGGSVVLTRYVKDGDSLHIYRKDWGWNYVKERYVCTYEFSHEFDLIDGDIVKHDGRTFEEYATERFMELMAARFPARPTA